VRSEIRKFTEIHDENTLVVDAMSNEVNEFHRGFDRCGVLILRETMENTIKMVYFSMEASDPADPDIQHDNLL
jgi:hypothetical protein